VYGLLNGVVTSNFPSGLILRKGIDVTSFYLPRYGLQSLDILDKQFLEEYPTVVKSEVKLE